MAKFTFNNSSVLSAQWILTDVTPNDCLIIKIQNFAITPRPHALLWSTPSFPDDPHQGALVPTHNHRLVWPVCELHTKGIASPLRTCFFHSVLARSTCEMHVVLVCFFPCCIVFHCMTMSLFVYPLTCWWTLRMFPIWGCLTICVHVFDETVSSIG